MQENYAKNLRIYRLKDEEHLTHRKIAALEGLTGERIFQIVKKLRLLKKAGLLEAYEQMALEHKEH